MVLREQPPAVEKSAPLPVPFRVEAIDLAGARRLHFYGELDVAAESAAQESIAVALGRPLTYLVVDLRELTFVDLTAFRVIDYASAACARCHVDLYIDADESLKRLAAVLPDVILGAAADYI